jgi:hypothetical protein
MLNHDREFDIYRSDVVVSLPANVSYFKVKLINSIITYFVIEEMEVKSQFVVGRNAVGYYE